MISLSKHIKRDNTKEGKELIIPDSTASANTGGTWDRHLRSEMLEKLPNRRLGTRSSLISRGI